MKEWDRNKKKKILILNASPRSDSATMLLTNSFVRGFTQNADADVETLELKSLNIMPCSGCLACWGKTDGRCVISCDDALKVKSKIEECDVFIESFPLYFFGMPGPLKVFTDRMLGMMCTYNGQLPPTDGASFHGVRYPHPNRRFVIISSCAYSDVKTVYEPLLKQFDCICGKDNYTPILCSQLQTLAKLDYPNTEARLNKFLEKFVAAGREFADCGELSAQTQQKLLKQPFGDDTYKVLLEYFWNKQRGGGQGE